MPYYRCAACGLTGYNAAGHSTANVCPNCAAPLGDARRIHVRTGTQHAVTRELPARAEAIAEARREVVGLALRRASRDELAVVVSELVTNAVRHGNVAAGGTVGLEITTSPGRVRVEVSDSGRGFDTPLSAKADPLEAGGQGLVIIDALSESWGVERGPGGCTVWCEVVVEGRESHRTDHGITGAYIRELAFELAKGAGRAVGIQGGGRMNVYTCASCGALAYSSANHATVGACPRCSAPLATPAPADKQAVPVMQAQKTNA